MAPAPLAAMGHGAPGSGWEEGMERGRRESVRNGNEQSGACEGGTQRNRNLIPKEGQAGKGDGQEGESLLAQEGLL